MSRSLSSSTPKPAAPEASNRSEDESLETDFVQGDDIYSDIDVASRNPVAAAAIQQARSAAQANPVAAARVERKQQEVGRWLSDLPKVRAQPEPEARAQSEPEARAQSEPAVWAEPEREEWLQLKSGAAHKLNLMSKIVEITSKGLYSSSSDSRDMKLVRDCMAVLSAISSSLNSC